MRADIDYGFREAKATYGRIGVKVWIYKGDLTQRELAAQQAASGGRPSRGGRGDRPARGRRGDRPERGERGGRGTRTENAPAEQAPESQAPAAAATEGAEA